MRIKCYNPKCLYERNYKGKFSDDNSVITCTKCRYKLKLGKAKIQSEVGIHQSEVPQLPHLPHEVTSQSEYKKDLDTKEGRAAERKRLDEEHKTLPELPGEVLPYEELADEIGGVKIK